MKHRVFKAFFTLLFISISAMAGAQSCGPLVGKPAPEFSAQAVVDGQTKQISLADYAGKNKILIFYPADFSFVCPTELFAFQEKTADFEQRDAVLLAVSVDQTYAHQAWLERSRDQGGIQGITYPLISDITKKISRQYQVLDEDQGVALRGVFVIDKDNIVQAVSINNLTIGRDIAEVLRVLDAVLFTQEHGQVCPANWTKGQKGMDATQSGLKEYLKTKE